MPNFEIYAYSKERVKQKKDKIGTINLQIALLEQEKDNLEALIRLEEEAQKELRKEILIVNTKVDNIL